MPTMFKLVRTTWSEKGNVFFAMPYGVKKARGEDFDFDDFWTGVCVPVVSDTCDMKPVRGDEIYGSQGVLQATWDCMDAADIVVVDFTARSANVAMEFGWALLLRKRIIVLTQNPEDIPTDVRGLYRYISYSKDYKDMHRLREELAMNLIAVSKEPAEEIALMPTPTRGMGSMTSAPAKVIHAEKEFVFVEDNGGRRGFLSNADVDYRRLIKDMSARYPVGTQLDGAFVLDPQRNEMRYTLLGGETNPWPQLEHRFPVGSTFHGTVANVVESIGVFVHLVHGITGLVPRGQFCRLPAPGTELDVGIVRIDEKKRQVSLRLESVPAAITSDEDAVSGEYAQVGWRGYGEVARIEPERDGHGGFILLRLPCAKRPAMMLARDMSGDLRHDLNHGGLELDEELYVEVLRVDPARRRTLLRELPDPDEEQQAA